MWDDRSMMWIKLFIASCILFLFLSPLATAVHADSCNYPDYCNTQSEQYNNASTKVGNDCIINGVSGAQYTYASTNQCGLYGWGSGSCLQRCGFMGSGFCCQPKDKNHPAVPSVSPFLPPPCKTDQGICVTVETAIGPINTLIWQLVQSVFGILLSLSGGVAILLIIAAGYQMIVSQGNPEKVKESRERLTAAIVGLLFIIFSVAILQFIGVHLLQIPGFHGK